MAQVNRGANVTHKTHEGAPAKRIDAESQLRRAVMGCMLWERQFYESGEDISLRISSLVPQVDESIVMKIAVEAREKMKLRHVPLLIIREAARAGMKVRPTLARVIQRADELSEFLAIYWANGKQPISKQAQRGLADAFLKFDEYQLAKYDRAKGVRLRDVLFLTHPKPKDDEQQALWDRLAAGELTTPDTWETNLSGGADKRETFERLIQDSKLGGIAFLRNLRNMQESGVSDNVIRQGFESANFSRVLPFRFAAAAKYAPRFEPQIERAMIDNLGEREKWDENVLLLIDRSMSMSQSLSAKSDMTRYDAACALAIILREICASATVLTFHDNRTMMYQQKNLELAEMPPRHGFALRDALGTPGGGTPLGWAIKTAEERYDHTRIVVLTDEQSLDPVPKPRVPGYMINVASYQNGVGYGEWTHIDGFSEAIVDYIQAYENVYNEGSLS